MKGIPGKSSSFEVFADGRLIYSKLQTGKFPNDEQVLEIIREMAGVKSPGTNSKPASSKHGCSHH